jgi:hypothetical protein
MSILLLQQNSPSGVSPGATGADNVVGTMILPASAFDIVGRGIEIYAAGSFAANSDTKTVKVIFNPASATLGSTVGASGTTVVSTGAVTISGGGWILHGYIFKYGASQQLCSGYSVVGPASQASGAVQATAPSTAAATDTAGIFLAVTANCVTATSDVVLSHFMVWGLN